jgi:hypothetical protein
VNARRLAAVFAVAGIAPASLAAQKAQLEVSAIGGRVEHRVSVDSRIEQAAGTVFGLSARYRIVGGWAELDGHASGGKLSAALKAGDDLSLGEAELRGSVLPLEWLAFQASVTRRSYTNSVARQRWTALGVGAEARLDILPGVRGILRTTLLPSVAVNGLERPDLAVSAASGLELDRGLLTAAIVYSVDRFDFGAVDGVARRQELSGLQIRFGVKR